MILRLLISPIKLDLGKLMLYLEPHQGLVWRLEVGGGQREHHARAVGQETLQNLQAGIIIIQTVCLYQPER